MTVISIPHITCRTIRNPAQRAEQCQLIGGGLVVVEDDVSKQRKRTAAIIWETNRKLYPVDRTAPELILAISCFLDKSSVFPRELVNFGLRDSVNAALGLRRSVTQGNCDAAAWLKEGNQLTEGACAIGSWNMHPDRT